MGKKLEILTDEGPIRWPGECASCCGQQKLKEVHVGIARNVTGVLDVLLGRARYRTLGMHYPVCGEHAGWAAFASWLTRKSPLPRVLRSYGYVIGVPWLVLFAIKGLIAVLALSAWYGGRSKQNPWAHLQPDDWLFPAMGAAGVVLLALTLLAQRRVPVRLARLRNDRVMIHFANDRYARHFARANPELLVSRR